jgi:cytoskeletal protein RodZ
MNRNQKIALGCGIAGCLGLILVVIICVVLAVLGYVAIPGTSNRNYNYNSNRNSNDNSNANNESSPDSNSNSDSSSSSLSDDDKHKLFQAAGMTKDQDLTRRVLRKIGYPNETGEEYKEFVGEHMGWAMKNFEFIRSVSTPEQARAYVEAHIDD